MYTGPIEQGGVSNRATWSGVFKAIDDDRQPIDTTDATEITLAIYDSDRSASGRGCCDWWYGPAPYRARLTGTLTDGGIVRVDPFTVQWTFTPSQMGTLPQGTYTVALTIEYPSGEIVQPLLGRLAVFEGFIR